MATKRLKKSDSRRRAARNPGSRVRVVSIGCWSEFVQIIEGWSGFRNWAFRGQADANWSLRSTLSRQIDVSGVCEEAWPLQEERIRRIFERKCHLYMDNPPQDDELEWLALMQHHGAPTRLLDFTWSPFVAAFFALEHATNDAAVWAINGPLLWAVNSRRKIGRRHIVDADPRDIDIFRKLFLPNEHAFIWQGDPFRMPKRVIAQSGTFLVSGHLGLSIEEIIDRYPGKGELLIKFVFDTASVREEAMATLYSMNITQATLFPGLDGLARSMAYEFEYSWQVDPGTNELRDSLRDPLLPPHVLAREGKAR